MRKVFSLILILCLCMSFTSCGSSIDDSTAFAGYASERYCSKRTDSDKSIFITLKPDGSIEGQDYYYNPDETGTDYEYGTIYGNLFNFELSKLKKIDEYTYSAVVGKIAYEYEPNTEEFDIVNTDDGNGSIDTHNVKNSYTAPLDGNRGGRVIIILPNSLIGNIPEKCYPYLETFGYSTEDKTKLLDTIVLYFETTGEAFVLLPG